jgi:hypothetical protein
MVKRNHKLQFWLGFLLLLILFSIDNFYFTEGRGAQGLSDSSRKVAHTLILFAIIPAGYLAWQRHPMQWLKRLWLWTHLPSILGIVGIGLVCYAAGYHDKAFLKKIGDIRLFFCSPAPFFIFCVLATISKRLPETAK